MTLETNAYASFNAVEKAEDVSDILYNIAPWETPVLSRIDKIEATAVTHEWLKDTLDTPSSSNAQLEGTDYTADQQTPPTRESNQCQLALKRPRVTRTQLATDNYGYKNRLNLEVTKKGRALKTDIESTILSNNAKVVREDTVAGACGGVESYFETNTSRGAGGSDGGSGTAATDGTQRPFTEALLKGVLANIADAGGDPDIIVVGSHNRQVLSTFPGNATRFDKAEDMKLHASVSVYISDFGQLEVVYDRHCRTRSALILQSDMLALASLRPMETYDMAITGESIAKTLAAEFTLEVREEASCGIVADLTTA